MGSRNQLEQPKTHRLPRMNRTIKPTETWMFMVLHPAGVLYMPWNYGQGMRWYGSNPLDFLHYCS